MAFRHKEKQKPVIHNPIESRQQRETYMDLIYMGSSKSQYLLSKLGAWEPWARVEEEQRGREVRGEKHIASKNN